MVLFQQYKNNKNKSIDKDKTLTIYINENNPDFEYIEVIRLGTNEHKIFTKKE